jgi:hypothetical protein
MIPRTDTLEIRADGRLLRFSSNLLNFLANRQAWHKFHLSDWLQSLDEDMLGHLQQLTEMALQDAQSMNTAVDDIVSLVLHALAAERQTTEITFNQDEIGKHVELLCLLSTLERLRRRGLLSYESVMSLELDAANAIVLAPDALVNEEELRRNMKRGLH